MKQLLNAKTTPELGHSTSTRPSRDRSNIGKPRAEEKYNDTRSSNVDSNISDRDRLTLQRPRTEASRLWGIDVSNWRKKSTVTAAGMGESKLKAEKEEKVRAKAAAICPECKQSDLNITRNASSSICRKCHRFISIPITALQQEPQPAPLVNTVEPPIYEYSSGPYCNTCLPVHRVLYQEYCDFFRACQVCRYMTDTTLQGLIRNEGDIAALVDSRGEVLQRPSKDLQDWCFAQAKHAHNIKLEGSCDSLAESITSVSSTSLQRSSIPALLRNRTHKDRGGSNEVTVRSISKKRVGPHPGLIPIEKANLRGGGAVYSNRYSFMSIGENDERHRGVTQPSRGYQMREHYAASISRRDRATCFQCIEEATKVPSIVVHLPLRSLAKNKHQVTAMARKDSSTSLPYPDDEPPTADELTDVRFFRISHSNSSRHQHANTSHEPVPKALIKGSVALTPRTKVGEYYENKSIVTDSHSNSIKLAHRDDEHLRALSQNIRELDQLEEMQRRYDSMRPDTDFNVQPARRPTVKEQHAIEVPGKASGVSLQHSRIKAIRQQEVHVNDFQRKNPSSVFTKEPDIKRTFSGILGKDYTVSEEEE